MTNHTDRVGTVYQSPNNKPAQNGVGVIIPTASGQTLTGTMIGGIVVPDKK